MQQNNISDSLRAFQKRKPFRPFIVEFVDGDRILVEHPEAVRSPGQGTAVYFGKKGQLMLYDHDGVARLSHHIRAAGAT